MIRVARSLAMCVAVVPVIGAGQAPVSLALVDRVLAVVARQVIMLSDVRAFLELGLVDPSASADPVPETLTVLIERQLVVNEISANVIEEPSTQEVEGQMAVVAERLGGLDALRAVLPTIGFTADDLKQLLREDLRVERYLARRFPGARQPTEEELAAWMREHADELRDDGALSLEAARDEARRQLTRALRQESIDAWISTLVDRADVYRVP
ncbi:MAG TPA: hypothetical protein DEQ98_07935 [Acidobacteria bacterium]|nr:hypothetical protein [Acidobacteriota bacterium]